MPSIKNKWVRPGSSFNYTEGVRVKNATAGTLNKNTVLAVTGAVGGVATVEYAVGLTALQTGMILICAHEIPAGEYGVGRPWMIIADVNTAAFALNQDLLLDGANGTWSAAGAGLGSRPVARVIKVGLTDGIVIAGQELSS